MATWGVWKNPASAIAWLLATDTAVAVWVATACATSMRAIHWGDLLRFAVIAACATAHLVSTREPEERRRDADGRGEHVDQTSIWLFSAALVLPVPLVLALLVLVRAQRYVIARKPAHTFIFTSASIAASAIGVHTVSTATPLYAWLTGQHTGLREPTLDLLIAVVGMATAVAVYFLLQALLVGTARGLITGSWSLSKLIGDRSTNGFILTTLFLAVCAGVLQALLAPLLLVMVPIAVRSTRVEQQLKEARANEQSAKTDSLHDALTGLLNRRGFNTDATMALLSDQRDGQETALLFCDLDHFKLWNDRLGHIGGDEVLKSVASVLPSHTRLGDVLCRWGGEELAVVLRNTGQSEARAIAERIRVSVANLEVTIRRPAGGKLIRLNSDGWPGCTISIGIAVAPEHGTELADLCELADQALRQAKDSGRNQVVLAPPAAGRAPAWSDTPVG